MKKDLQRFKDEAEDGTFKQKADDTLAKIEEEEAEAQAEAEEEAAA
jgi:hypothetical protein